jgi:hypothetical protein
MLAKEGFVFPPGLRRRLGERAVEGKERFRRLARELEQPVGRREYRDEGGGGRQDAQRLSRPR